MEWPQVCVTGVVVFSLEMLFLQHLSLALAAVQRLDNAIHHINLYPLVSVCNMLCQHLSTG